jgi:cyclopropane fatty-acyl-phospholipid synthase-like methyltransferase
LPRIRAIAFFALFLGFFSLDTVDAQRRVGSSKENRDERARHVISVTGLERGQTVADIGFGRGWLTERLAPHVGDSGLVYAVEVSETSVERLRERQLPQVTVVHSKHDDVSLPEGCLDVAMMHDVASHVRKEGRRRFYGSIRRALKKDGILVIFGPHGKAREMLAELRRYGFQPDGEAELLALEHWRLDDRLWAGIVFRYTGVHLF